MGVFSCPALVCLLPFDCGDDSHVLVSAEERTSNGTVRFLGLVSLQCDAQEYKEKELVEKGGNSSFSVHVLFLPCMDLPNGPVRGFTQDWISVLSIALPHNSVQPTARIF